MTRIESSYAHQKWNGGPDNKYDPRLNVFTVEEYEREAKHKGAGSISGSASQLIRVQMPHVLAQLLELFSPVGSADEIHEKCASLFADAPAPVRSLPTAPPMGWR
jgi:hypothetical protein